MATGSTITADDVRDALGAYEAKLDGSFFGVRLDRATELQRACLRAMAERGAQPQKSADVAEIMGRSSTNLGPTGAELVTMGLLCTPEHGDAAFTVPHVDKVIIRAIPTVDVPPKRGSTPRKAKT